MKRLFAVLAALSAIVFSGCMELFENDGISASYTVECYRRNAEDSGYALWRDGSSVHDGIAGRMTGVIAKPLAGFTVKTITQKKIRSDGSTVVQIYYERKTVTLSFNPDGGTPVPSSVSGKYGAPVQSSSITPPTKAGYTFGGWKPTLPSTFPADDTTYTAQWNAGGGTTYKVEHYQEKVAGGYELVNSATETKTGTTGANAVYTAKTYTGFTYDASKTNINGIKQSSGTINADGTTVVKLYYNRKTVTLTLDSNGGTHILSSVSGKYGATVPTVTAPTKAGYTFDSWTPQLPATFPAGDTTYTAQWNAGGGTPYKVEHYQEDIASGYKLVNADTENKTGTTGTNAAYSPKTYTGFTHDSAKTNINGIKQLSGSINADGTTVVKLYYNRKTVTLTFNADGGTPVPSSVSGKYGAPVQSSSITPPTKAGYTFGGWTPQLPATFPANDETYTAQWNAGGGTAYKVEHYQEDIAGGNYTKIDTENKTGTTGANAVYSPKTYTGFTYDASKTNINGIKQSSGTINADGTTVVKLYYNRKTVTLTLDSNGGTPAVPSSISGKYGAPVQSSSITPPTKAGAAFDGWNPQLPTEFPAENKTYMAKWKAADYKITGLKYKSGFGGYDNRYIVTPDTYASQINSVWFNGEPGNKKDHKNAIGAAGQNKDLKAYCIERAFIYFHKELEVGTKVELKDTGGNVLGSFTYQGEGVDFTANN
ncbi:MAG: InlB B-repeat-containing protein [Treponema sp.]